MDRKYLIPDSSIQTGVSRYTVWLGLGTVLTAFAASLCCILPAAVAVLGVGSAAMGAWLAPWRPLFLTMTVLLQGTAFYREYRRGKGCAEESCRPVAARRRRLMLWIVTALTLTLVTFPHYMEWILRRLA